MRRISIGLNWQGGFSMDAVVEQAKVADDSGVDSIFAAEAWGRDAFTTLAILAHNTNNIHLGTSIVNIYSRTPAALAQHFGTLDELTGGRMIIGLGSTSSNVTDHFHGIKYGKALTRMREYIEIINTLIADEPLHHDGEYFKGMERGFTLRDINLPRKHIPIYIASITPKSVLQTAQTADGWMPIFTPREQWAEQVGPFREAVEATGRNFDEVTIRSSSSVTVTDDPESAKQGVASGAAFYIARMGDFYYEHFVRMGYADEANAVRAAWRDGGAAAGVAAVPDELVEGLGVAGSVEECIEWMEAAEDAGYKLHGVNVREQDPKKRADIFRQLVG
jgi:F420-dependent oxidoreductase-like protein